MATIWIDGQFHSQEDAKISVYDHGLLYGDGIFEGIRIYHGRIFKLKEHLLRLFDSAQALWLTIPHTFAELEEILREVVKTSGRSEGYIRLVVTRGVGTLGLDPQNCRAPSVIVIVDDIQLYPRELYEKGIPVITASTRRTPRESFEARIKSLNYLNNIMAKIEAHRAGVLEAIMLNTEGLVAECTADNIFLVKKGALSTPSTIHGALAGITRHVVLQLADRLKIPASETAVALFDVYTADEVFITGSGAELMPVIQVDGRVIGKGTPGPLTVRLLEEFRKEARGN